MIFQHLFLTKVIRPVRSLRLFLLQGDAWVLGGGPVASSRDDQSCDREDSDKGGEIVATGTPEEVAKVEASYTGQYLGPVIERTKKFMGLK